MHADDWHDTRIYALFTGSWLDTRPSPLSAAVKQLYKGHADSDLNLKAQRFLNFLPPAAWKYAELTFNDLPAVLSTSIKESKIKC